MISQRCWFRGCTLEWLSLLRPFCHTHWFMLPREIQSCEEPRRNREGHPAGDWIDRANAALQKREDDMPGRCGEWVAND